VYIYYVFRPILVIFRWLWNCWWNCCASICMGYAPVCAPKCPVVRGSSS
jgi:hypothetical protein